MPTTRHCLPLAAATVLLVLSANTTAQRDPAAAGFAISQQRAAVLRSEQIMAAANRRSGLLAQYLYMRDSYSSATDAAFRVIFNQYVSWYQTWVGDYAGARSTFSIAQPAAGDDAASPLAGDFRTEPAVDTIAALAKGRQAVFFNEAHSNALTRTVTLQLLPKLRAEGFDHFAAETLYDSDDGLARRGYPVADSGFYTEEPIYADIIRTALKLGFTVVAYEATSDATGDEREREQARNLIAATLKKNPAARIVVNAGFGHIQKAGSYLKGQSMAQHFRRISGIEPLSVEQTMLTPHEKPASDHPYYAAIIAASNPQQPIVFRDGGGKPWSLKDGAYDISVVFPPESFERGRPTWLSIGGQRQRYPISGDLCSLSYPCLVEARHADEGDDAIPADRTVIALVKGQTLGGDHVRESSDAVPLSQLWLRPGNYRLVARDVGNRIVSRRTITVRDRINSR